MYVVNFHNNQLAWDRACTPYVNTKASVGACALQTQKDRETGTRCETRKLRYTCDMGRT